ncbi:MULTISPECIES: aromatic ring-hydroxylating dioxygenase subunit alpha [Streptomyces]|uniref:Aromatic ring-hydroxylating dioxygenase subunit alpha n=2 Tax=Streptomyces TaxID=1883 RepID=A0A3R7INU2_9ACTN|nr:MULTISPECIES: aromatic ring-hydroxylating dioxygenase subunit alpha [Streptomyces]KNE82691.1 Rieske (2Fe-2S) protein [Streptomyces fradiae]OFA52323.1 Rieske (2Fe-2S) protein [Streptomyces fradiae]PQM20990.1 aromatic ring-hydroxylating dioxygenase subunit alpha [Streptomyces xinghaiensis]RKM92844.1 aromatic ring-hydroxylating dioxygenase subunit alpha [Streptomyces xinghaiensis]RNC72432.1 aromatic ring-hydroxylating dioxygenase subunit alpha [Streptomyces xinghaiensis]
MTAFVRNQWYVAAYGREVGRELLGRTVLGEPILLYRTEDGRTVAMSDRCVHRRFPLSQAPSRLTGDHVMCGYHGFTYGTDGVCVFVPGQQRIPRTARLKTYPVIEQDSFVWVWIGDHEPGDVVPPRAPWMDSPDYTVVSGMEPIDGDYGLLVDNLLDLSHETYLHGGYIGTPEVAQTPITTEVDDAAGIVHVSRHMDDAECPPFYAKSTGIETRITRWQDIEYHAPCLYLLHSRIAPVGAPGPGPDGSDPHAFHVEVVYGITPSTERTTYDFWAVARDFALGDEKVSEFLHTSNHTVVMQDVVALNALQKSLDTEKPGYQELSINIDTGGLAARRILARLAQAGADQPATVAR